MVLWARILAMTGCPVIPATNSALVSLSSLFLGRTLWSLLPSFPRFCYFLNNLLYLSPFWNISAITVAMSTEPASAPVVTLSKAATTSVKCHRFLWRKPSCWAARRCWWSRCRPRRRGWRSRAGCPRSCRRRRGRAACPCSGELRMSFTNYYYEKPRLPNCEELNIRKFVSHENEYPRLCICLDNKLQSGKKAVKWPWKLSGHLAFLLNCIEFPKWGGSLPLSMVLKVFFFYQCRCYSTNAQ